MKDEYYNEDNSPKKCYECSSKEMYNVIKSSIEGTVCEEEIFCSKCNTSIGYFAYGYYDPSYCKGRK